MKFETESLSDHTTLKIGGPAEMSIPDTRDDLIEVLRECEDEGRPYRLLGNGSNLLVSDEGVDDLVIKLTECCSNIEFDGRRVTVGSSVMLPQFLLTCLERDLGGYEYLYSVPGTIGGAIYMNAGRGAYYGQTIADHLERVELFDGSRVQELSASEIELDHRYSSFQYLERSVILRATFQLPERPAQSARELISERMSKVEDRERSKPNAGSVFKSGTSLPLHRIPPNGLSVGSARFVSSNRICHDGDASFDDVFRLIRRAKFLYRIVPSLDVPEVEWRIWK